MRYIKGAHEVTSHNSIRGSKPSEDPVNRCEAQAFGRNIATHLSEDDHESTLYKNRSTASQHGPTGFEIQITSSLSHTSVQCVQFYTHGKNKKIFVRSIYSIYKLPTCLMRVDFPPMFGPVTRTQEACCSFPSSSSLLPGQPM